MYLSRRPVRGPIAGATALSLRTATDRPHVRKARRTPARERSHSVKVRRISPARALLALVVCGAGIVAGTPPATPMPAPSPAAKPSPPLSQWQRRQRETYQNSAPADEYFGKLKLSFLGINNTFRDAAISSGEHTIDPQLVAKVGFADDALSDWASHFPRDPQLARTYYLAIESEQRIWLKPNQERAYLYMNRIVTQFGNSYFGKIVAKNLAIGFTEHYYAAAVACPTPVPSPTPTVEPSLAPTASPTAQPRHRTRAAPTPSPAPTVAVTPSPEPSPSPTPTPMPTPRVLSKGLAVMIETPACILATPSPEPRVSPSASASLLQAPRPSTTPAFVPSPAVSPSRTAGAASAG
jgi:hypothetical protein